MKSARECPFQRLFLLFTEILGHKNFPKGRLFKIFCPSRLLNCDNPSTECLGSNLAHWLFPQMRLFSLMSSVSEVIVCRVMLSTRITDKIGFYCEQSIPGSKPTADNESAVVRNRISYVFHPHSNPSRNPKQKIAWMQIGIVLLMREAE